MHRTINEDNKMRPKPVLELKIGIHHGSCIAVNMNNVMDYFGTAVNLAARIQKQSQGGDVVVTEDVWNDPKVQEVLSKHVHSLEVINYEVRGLRGERTVYRLSQG